VGERPPGVRYADPGIFEHAPRCHGGGFAGSALLPDEVPIIARSGELVVPPERVVREQRPITVMISVTAAEANSFRASQGQIAAEMRALRSRSSSLVYGGRPGCDVVAASGRDHRGRELRRPKADPHRRCFNNIARIAGIDSTNRTRL
jgi:hypothetical protein